MELDLDAPNLAEMEIPAIELPARQVGVGIGVVAVAPLEARIAGRLPVPHASRERLKGPVEASQYVLQHVGGDLLKLFPHFCFDLGQIVLL
jgi:hypothetical protein